MRKISLAVILFGFIAIASTACMAQTQTCGTCAKPVPCNTCAKPSSCNVCAPCVREEGYKRDVLWNKVPTQTEMAGTWHQSEATGYEDTLVSGEMGNSKEAL